MNLHSLENVSGARSRRKRLGRGMGSGTGKTCGKGHKGQMARKGHKRKPGFEGGQMRLVRRVPKRGFKNPVRQAYRGVNVGALSCFAAGTEVTSEILKSAGLAQGQSGFKIKILGGGELDRKLTVKAPAFSQTARAKIEAAGGTCEVVQN
jgi:large subunit ribosomal protein L15